MHSESEGGLISATVHDVEPKTCTKHKRDAYRIKRLLFLYQHLIRHDAAVPETQNKVRLVWLRLR